MIDAPKVHTLACQLPMVEFFNKRLVLPGLYYTKDSYLCIWDAGWKPFQSSNNQKINAQQRRMEEGAHNGESRRCSRPCTINVVG